MGVAGTVVGDLLLVQGCPRAPTMTAAMIVVVVDTTPEIARVDAAAGDIRSHSLEFYLFCEC